MGKRPVTKELLNAAGSAQAVAVNATATVYTEIVTLDKHEGFTIFYQAASGGTISLDVVLQVSFDGSTFADLTGVPKIHSTLAASTLNAKFLGVPMVPYIRIKITGTGSNAATTTIRHWLTY